MSGKVKGLTATDLRKSYSGRLVVGGVSIFVKEGEVVGLLGPNGAGKTTSFYMIVGLIRPDSGSVMIDDRDITALPVYERARAGIGYLPQEASVFRNLTVRENINLVWQETGRQRFASELTQSLLEQFKITHIAETKGYALSGGERRRVEIARALTLKPKFILLDEPFSGIDPIAVADIQSMIHELKRQGYGVLITDHNVRETLSITDRTYLIHDGKIFLAGSPEEVAENELARKFYLGENFQWNSKSSAASTTKGVDVKRKITATGQNMTRLVKSKSDQTGTGVLRPKGAAGTSESEQGSKTFPSK